MTSTLEGELLLVILPWKPSDAYLDSLESAFPGLQIITHQTETIKAEETKVEEILSGEDWAKVTVLLSYYVFPPPELAPKLRYVQLLSAGCNQLVHQRIYAETAQDAIAFCNASGVHPPQIAEWVFATFLSHQHYVPFYLDAMKQSNWIEPENDEDIEDAVGLKMGVLGYGCIGRQCARVAQALGMEVHAFTRTPRPTPESRRDESYIEKPGMGDPEGEIPTKWFSGGEELNDFLGSGLDLLVIAMPLTKSTTHMISSPEFELLSKRKAYVSNVGRGAIIRTPDLVQALESGMIRGAALDVTDPEPLPADHALWKCRNLIVTPHVSGNSNHYNERVLGILKYNLTRLSEGKDLVNKIDKAQGY